MGYRAAAIASIIGIRLIERLRLRFRVGCKRWWRNNGNWSSQNEGWTLYALLVSWTSARAEKATQATEDFRCRAGSARTVQPRSEKQQPSSAVCWGLRECQHYPPSWVEANTSLDQVVSGSATPASASQWNSCRTGSRASAPGSRGYTRSVRNREQTSMSPHPNPSPRWGEGLG
jgi:hypothetical protein